MKTWSEEPAYTHGGKRVDMRVLHSTLLSDLTRLGLDTSGFELVLRPYSRTWDGTYNSRRRIITLYVYRDEGRCVPYSYKELFCVLLHEYVHYKQWTNPNYVRWKGIMHDAEFYEIYNGLEPKARCIFEGRGSVV